MYFSIEDILDKKQVVARAKSKWDCLTIPERMNKGRIYRHIAINDNNLSSWVDAFDNLDKQHQNILIKSELIRTYDSMLMSDKRKLSSEANLSKFKTKWFKFTNEDKTKLLNHVLSIHEKS